jgi:hypothetical protein
MARIPRLLDHELLDRLDDCLRAHGALALRDARPGPKPLDVAAKLASFPGTIPTELITWWSHRRWTPGAQVLPGAQAAPIENALEWYAFHRELGRSDWGEEADDFWPPAWLPVLGRDGISFVADTAHGSEDTAPIKFFESIYFKTHRHGRVIADSLGDFVQFALDEIDDGLWVLSADGCLWISPDRRTTEPGPRPLGPPTDSSR